jgi:hypothetical protein
MLNDKLNAQGDSTPAAVAPPNAKNTEQVARHHRSAQGRYGGQALSPPSSYQHFVFHFIAKGILQSRKIKESV